MPTNSREITGYLVENFAGMADGKSFSQDEVESKLSQLDEKLLETSMDPNDTDITKSSRS